VKYQNQQTNKNSKNPTRPFFLQQEPELVPSRLRDRLVALPKFTGDPIEGKQNGKKGLFGGWGRHNETRKKSNFQWNAMERNGTEEGRTRACTELCQDPKVSNAR
jgi:hypothetical protein